jgi:hypothetical protein
MRFHISETYHDDFDQASHELYGEGFISIEEMSFLKEIRKKY